VTWSTLLCMGWTKIDSCLDRLDALTNERITANVNSRYDTYGGTYFGPKRRTQRLLIFYTDFFDASTSQPPEFCRKTCLGSWE
jgi:hypothetical protein